MRQKLAVKSSAIGLCARLLAMVLSIISARLFVKYLGMEIKGVSGVIANILSLLQLAEMGIGTAIIYALYQPIVEKNKEEIKSLMAFYKKAYNCIGLMIFVIGCVVSLFLKFFVGDTTYSWKYVYLIYFIQLIASVSTYLVGAYRRNLLYADQKQYITAIIDSVTNTIFTIMRMFVIVYMQSYIVYLVLQLIQTLVSNLIAYGATNKYFPYLREKNVKPYDKMPELVENVKNVIIGKIGGVVYNSTDNIIISKFVGVVAVGYMTNYYTVKSMIKTIVTSVTEPVRPMIGNYIREYKEVDKSYQLFLSYTFIRYFIANIVTVGVLVMFNPFIDLWMGEGYTLSMLIPAFIAIDMFIDIVHGPTWEFINVLGLFKNDRNMSYGGAVINIVTSIILVIFMGTPGVLLGTVIAQCYYWIARARIVFKQYFKDGVEIYIKRIIAYIFVTAFDTAIMLFLRYKLMPVTNVLMFVLLCVISITLSSFSVWLIWGRTEDFWLMSNMIKKVLTRKNRDKREDLCVSE